MIKIFSQKHWLVVAVIAASSISLWGQNTKDHKVYEAAVRYMFRDGITQFDMLTKVETIVIRDRTHSSYASSGDKENWDQVKITMRSLTDETIAAYEAARKSEKKLEAKLDIPIKYQLITDEQLKDIFPKPQDYDLLFGYWQNFRKIYPKSAGYNSFSRVGYDKAGRQALVYYVNSCGTLCGTGTYLLVIKDEKGWEVKEGRGMWIR